MARGEPVRARSTRLRPSPAPTARRPVSAGTERLDETVWRTRIPDGPVVLSERLEGVRSVALGLWVRQGTALERPEERGISHLLEHMVFKGTRRRSARDLVLEVERIGGAVDAFTGHEVTAYHARVPDEALGPALDVLADLAFRPSLRARDLDPERKVILEELAALEDTPEELVFELQAAHLFDGHPYGAPILGTAESVSRLDAAALRRLHRASYRGPNTVVAAAGRLDHVRLVDLARELVPVGPAEGARVPPAVEAGRTGYRRLERAGGRQSHIVAGGLTVPYAHPLRHAVVLVDTAFGAGMSSRLFQRIREERGLAYSVYSFHAFFARGGHAGAYVGAGPETADAAREALLEEFRRLSDEGLDAHEAETAKEQLKGRIKLSVESPMARMSRLAGLALYEEPYRGLDEVAARIDAVTDGQLREAAALLDPDRLAVLELAPVPG